MISDTTGLSSKKNRAGDFGASVSSAQYSSLACDSNIVIIASVEARIAPLTLVHRRERSATKSGSTFSRTLCRIVVRISFSKGRSFSMVRCHFVHVSCLSVAMRPLKRACTNVWPMVAATRSDTGARERCLTQRERHRDSNNLREKGVESGGRER